MPPLQLWNKYLFILREISSFELNTVYCLKHHKKCWNYSADRELHNEGLLFVIEFFSSNVSLLSVNLDIFFISRVNETKQRFKIKHEKGHIDALIAQTVIDYC